MEPSGAGAVYLAAITTWAWDLKGTWLATEMWRMWARWTFACLPSLLCCSAASKCGSCCSCSCSARSRPLSPSFCGGSSGSRPRPSDAAISSRRCTQPCPAPGRQAGVFPQKPRDHRAAGGGGRAARPKLQFLGKWAGRAGIADHVNEAHAP